jgi:hypothetical protein
VPIFIVSLFIYSKDGNYTSIYGQRMDKQNVVPTYNGVLFSLENEGHSDTRYNTDGT